MTATQLAFDLPVRPAMGREDFFVSPCNQPAVDWIDRWPDWPYPCTILWGPSGCGKTHLSQVWQERAGALWAADRSPEEVMEAAGQGRAICLDINGQVADETALFHLFNWTREHGGSLLLTGNAPPRDWPLALPDLRSRLQAAPSLELSRPDDALLAAVTVKLFADRQLAVTPDLLNYLLQRADRSFAALGEAVDRLDKAALQEKRPITPRFAKRVLGL
jgi:DnaA regulatory inactivator Hda